MSDMTNQLSIIRRTRCQLLNVTAWTLYLVTQQTRIVSF